MEDRAKSAGSRFAEELRRSSFGGTIVFLGLQQVWPAIRKKEKEALTKRHHGERSRQIHEIARSA